MYRYSIQYAAYFNEKTSAECFYVDTCCNTTRFQTKVGPQRGKTDRYRNNLATLDIRIKNFSIRNSAVPCKKACFTKGVSCFIPDSKSSTAALGSSGMNATKLEAQKYLSILFQLMICIGMYNISLNGHVLKS
jgi:hypothetical protein